MPRGVTDSQPAYRRTRRKKVSNKDVTTSHESSRLTVPPPTAPSSANDGELPPLKVRPPPPSRSRYAFGSAAQGVPSIEDEVSEAWPDISNKRTTPPVDDDKDGVTGSPSKFRAASSTGLGRGRFQNKMTLFRTNGDDGEEETEAPIKSRHPFRKAGRQNTTTQAGNIRTSRGGSSGNPSPDDSLAAPIARVVYRDDGFPYEIPGPAGSNFSKPSGSGGPKFDKRSAKPRASQQPGHVELSSFEKCVAWHKMLKGLNITPYGGGLMHTTLMFMKDKAKRRLSSKSDIAVRICGMKYLGKYPSLTLEDPTGKITATLLLDLIECPNGITIGSVMVLTNVFAVLYPTCGNSGMYIDYDRRIHMTISKENLVDIYPVKKLGDVGMEMKALVNPYKADALRRTTINEQAIRRACHAGDMNFGDIHNQAIVRSTGSESHGGNVASNGDDKADDDTGGEDFGREDSNDSDFTH